VYHDGLKKNISVDDIVRVASSSRTVIVAKPPIRPSWINSHTPHSTILVAEDPSFLLEVRTWPMWNARGRTLVLVEPCDDVHGWLSALWHLTRAVHVTVMVLSEPPEFFTWIPYQLHECGNVTTLTKMNGTQLFSYEVKPPLNKCPLYAVTTHLNPLVKDEEVGIETRMYLTMAEKMGMRSEYVELPPNTRVWTCLDREGKPVNGMKLIFDNKVDVMFSSLRVRLVESTYAEFLASHATDAYLWFVPSPKTAPRVTAIYRAFHPDAWALVLSASIIIWAVALLLPRLETGKFHSPFLSSVSIVLNTSTNFPPSKAFSIFAVLAYIYSLHITTAYQSSFIIFLSDVVREKPIKDVGDIVDSGLKIEFFESQYHIIQDLAKSSSQYAALTKGDRALFVNYMHLASVAAWNISLLGPGLAFRYLIRDKQYHDENGYPLVTALKKEHFPGDLTTYISRGHPLQPILHQYSRRLVEAGMPIYYLREQLTPDIRQMRFREPFDISNVEGPFLLHLSLLAISFFVWFFELLYYYFTTSKHKKAAIKDPWSRLSKLQNDYSKRKWPSHWNR